MLSLFGRWRSALAAVVAWAVSVGAAAVLYDGSPAHPGPDALWRLAERTGTTFFGTSAAYIAACMKAGIRPREGRDLSALRSVGSTGSPLSPEGFAWVYDEVGADTWLFSTSGGTDLCTAFVGGVATLPVYRGELQARGLGKRVQHAFQRHVINRRMQKRSLHTAHIHTRT